MPAPFPHHYSTTIVRTGTSLGSIQAAARPNIKGGAPPEFGGDATVWSPEHLLMASLGLCLETTFEAFAARERLPITGWTADVEGTLDRTQAGLAFTRIVVHVDVVVDAGAEDRARAVLARAEKACIVSAALRVPVEIEASVAAASGAAA